MNNSPSFRRNILVKVIASAAWFVIVASLQSMFVAVVAMWRGVPTTLHNIAVHWQGEAFLKSQSSLYDTQIYWFFYILAGVMFVLGWILCSYATLILLRLIF
jgi:hypothetical protein